MLFPTWEDAYNYASNGYIRVVPGVSPRSTNIRLVNKNYVALSYQGSVVVKFTPTGITLHRYGWLTNTTKSRMNMACPPGVKVYTKKDVWYIDVQDLTLPFVDGMSVTWDGKQAFPPKD